MANKKKGSLTVSKEYARHLRAYGKRVFNKGERKAAKRLVEKEH